MDFDKEEYEERAVGYLHREGVEEVYSIERIRKGLIVIQDRPCYVH